MIDRQKAIREAEQGKVMTQLDGEDVLVDVDGQLFEEM